MSRMLDALKQIEARHTALRSAVEPVSANELASFGLDRRAAPWDEVAPSEDGPFVPAPPEDGSPAPAASEDGPSAPAPPEKGPSAPAFGPQYVELADKILTQCRVDRPMAFLFTSPGDREGKTSTLVPLSLVVAERLGDEVVLVDASFRRPGVAEYFDLPEAAGLADVLSGVRTWGEAVCRTPAPHLSVLPAGRFPAGDGLPREPLNVAPLLKELRTHYRLILLDTPSLVHPLAAPMARHCDGVYLIVQLGRTSRRATAQAVELLEACNARLLGGILTQRASRGKS